MFESTLFIEGIGIVAGALGLCAWIPQTLDVWVKKKNDGVSLCYSFTYHYGPYIVDHLWILEGFNFTDSFEWNRVVYHRIRSIGNHQTPS